MMVVSGVYFDLEVVLLLKVILLDIEVTNYNPSWWIGCHGRIYEDFYISVQTSMVSSRVGISIIDF